VAAVAFAVALVAVTVAGAATAVAVAVAVAVAIAAVAAAAPQNSEWLCVGAYGLAGTVRFEVMSDAGKAQVSGKRTSAGIIAGGTMTYLLTRRGATPLSTTLLLHG
jgi:hypothetical protein